MKALLRCDGLRVRKQRKISDLRWLAGYPSAMISSQSALLLVILASSFDSDMTFTDQINSLSKSCHFHIRDIRRIRHLLPLSAATALANSLVFSKLDYTEHCSVGPTNFIETITARLKISVRHG